MIIDLEKKETETDYIDEGFVEDYLGGASMNMVLYEEHKDSNPIVIGSGFFTSTFAPCSCLGVITAKSPLNNSVCHVPLTWHIGSELKLSGFDFIVLKGKADQPTMLWLHDEVPDILDASELWGKDTWETTDYIREDKGDEFVQVLCIGKAGENRAKISQLSENYWGSADKYAFSSIFGEKKLKAIAIRGLGRLKVADGFFEKATKTLREITGGTILGKQGMKEFIPYLEADDNIKRRLKRLVHRHNACFNCPFPCRTFVKFRSDEEEPGVMISDLSGLLGFNAAGLQVTDSIKSLEVCYRLGLEPTATSALIKKSEKTNFEDVVLELENLSTNGADLTGSNLPNFCGVSPWPIKNSAEANLVQAFGIFSNWAPPKALAEGFLLPDSAVDKAEWWIKRVALSHILGICPIFSLTTPELKEEGLLELINTCTGWNFTPEKLQEIIVDTIKDTTKAGEKTGDIHESLKTEDFDSQLKELTERFA